MEKTVEANSEVLAKDDIALTNDAPQRHFEMASKQMMPSSSSSSGNQGINVDSLLFFQALQANASGGGGEGVQGSPPVAISTQSGMDNGNKIEEADSDASSPRHDGNSGLSALAFALPKSKNKPTAKAKPKAIEVPGKNSGKGVSNVTLIPGPKPAVKPERETKAEKPPTRKRKVSQGMEDTDEAAAHALKVHRMDTLGSDSLDNLSHADKATINEYTEKFNTFKATSFKNILDGDTGTTDGLKQASKDLSSFTASIKSKIKSLQRRKDNNMGIVKQELEDIVLKVTEVVTLVHSLIGLCGEDLVLVDQLDSLSDWTFSKALYKRAFKCAMISHLKYENWGQMTSSTRGRMIKVLGDEEGQSFFDLVLNDVIQRMLRSINNRVSRQNKCLAKPFLGLVSWFDLIDSF